MCEIPKTSEMLDLAKVDSALLEDKKCSTLVKKELKDCIICTNRDCEQWHDLCWSVTAGGQTPFVTFLCRVADVRPSTPVDTAGGFVCGTCFDLVNILEHAELEYYRLKENLTTILSSNSFFVKNYSEAGSKQDINTPIVKNECDADNSHIIPIQYHQPTKSSPSKKKRGRKLGRKKKQSVEKIYSDSDDDTTLLQLKEESYSQRSPELPTIENYDHENLDWTDAPIYSEPDESTETKTKKVRRRVKENNKSSSGNNYEGENSMENLLVPFETLQKNLNLANGEKKKVRKKEKITLICADCNAVFNSISRFNFHRVKHDESSKPPYICEICGAHYKKKKACDVHVAMHKGIGDWKCEQCNRLFPSKAALNRHNNIHTGTPNYQCDLCGKSFIHTSSFKMHKLSHTGIKPHPCDVCGLRLLTKSHLKRHKRIHTGEKRHECPSCGKKFSERYNLLSHQKSHEQDGIDGANKPPPVPKPRVWNGFRCNLCEKRFERRYILEKHMEMAHQRIMERGPPKPRNTMTKLLKAQAAAVGKLTVRTDLAANETETDASVLRDAQGNKNKEGALEPTADPLVVVKPEKSEKTKNASESASTSDRASTFEAYDALRSANGAWPYIPAEYLRSLPELQQ